VVGAKVVVRHKLGLHARPAAKFVQTANKFSSDITVKNVTSGGEEVNAKSIILVLTLGVICNHEIEVRARGADEREAVKGLVGLVEGNFDEPGE
jgi:phosphotransferase system HPr (HPr) family protein